MLQNLEFASCCVYSPKGASDASARSRAVVARLKRGDAQLIDYCATRIRVLADNGKFPGFFDPDVTLVPVPGSSPRVQGALWVPFLIAEALAAVKLGHVAPILARTRAVKKSAFQAPADRPDAQAHYDSFAVDIAGTPATDQIALIDDVVTQGCTMLAAASRLAETFPEREIRGFAVVRTMSGVEVMKILDPCVGTIKSRGDRAVRRP